MTIPSDVYDKVKIRVAIDISEAIRQPVLKETSFSCLWFLIDDSPERLKAIGDAGDAGDVDYYGSEIKRRFLSCSALIMRGHGV